jgi:two-component system sensor histidine kinase UhpB
MLKPEAYQLKQKQESGAPHDEDAGGGALSVLRRFWRSRSVRTQLVVTIGAVNLLALAVAGTVSVLNSQVATRVEVEASLEVAQRFVDATVRDLASQGKLDRLADELPRQLKHLRHVRIMLVDSFGNLTVMSPRPGELRQWTPAWFKALVAPKLEGRMVRVVSTGGLPVVIVGHPEDEIAEAWGDFYVFTLVWLSLNLVVLLVLYAILGKLLRPLVNLARGLLKLEVGQYATRLTRPRAREIAVITDQFNALAGALGTAREETSALYRQLITVQETERREIATELHDEAGPCLFGITANASSIKTIAGQIDDANGPELARRVDEVLTIAGRLKSMNRELLKKLRPGPLGHVKLAQLLDELISGLQRRYPECSILISIDTLAESYGEAIDLTLYRCIQEGVAYATRRDSAHTVLIEVGEHAAPGRGSGPKTLRLVIRDDGTPAAGAAAEPEDPTRAIMGERVRSLGGSVLVAATSSEGTAVSIEIPVPRRARARKSRKLELAEESA